MHLTYSADVALNLPRSRTSATTSRTPGAASQGASSGVSDLAVLPQSPSAALTVNFVVHMLPFQVSVFILVKLCLSVLNHFGAAPRRCVPS